MKEYLKAFSSKINTRQVFIGLSVLLLETLVYVVDRLSDNTYFVYKSFVNVRRGFSKVWRLFFSFLSSMKAKQTFKKRNFAPGSQ